MTSHSPSSENVGPRVCEGVRWAAVSSYSVQTVQTVVSLVLARILAPEDYGLMAMAVVIIGFVQIFQNPGIVHALIQCKEINERLLHSLFVFSLAIALVLVAAVFACGRWIAAAYDDERVPLIAGVVSLGFVFSALGLVPVALLNRQMSFKRLAARDLAQAAATGVSAFALALNGWGVWSLAWCGNAGAVAGTFAVYALCPWRPRFRFHWNEVKKILSFGGNMTGSQVFNYASRKSDDFIIGSLLGPAPLGYYSLAYRFLLLPREAVTSIVGRVLFPVFSRLQQDAERVRDAYLRGCGAIALVTFPLMLGLMAVAEPFVSVVLGERWLPAAPLIVVLAPVGMLQSIGCTVGQLCMAKGRADLMFRLALLSGPIHVFGFLIGVQWGVFGVAVSYAITGTLLLYPAFRFAFRLYPNLRLRDLLAVVAVPGAAAATMALSVFMVRAMLATAQAEPAAVLLICVVLGIVVYLSIILILRPPAFEDLLRVAPGRWVALVRPMLGNPPGRGARRASAVSSFDQ